MIPGLQKLEAKQRRSKRRFGVVYVLIGAGLLVLEYYVSPGYYLCAIAGGIYVGSGVTDIYDSYRQ